MEGHSLPKVDLMTSTSSHLDLLLVILMGSPNRDPDVGHRSVPRAGSRVEKSGDRVCKGKTSSKLYHSSILISSFIFHSSLFIPFVFGSAFSNSSFS